MSSQPVKYPVGIQTFEKIREGGYLYIDKTALVHKLANSSQYVFLNRPRRFGKSLLLSTFKAYFEGRRELFDGLDISRMETQWTPHPVIRIDFTGESYERPEKLREKLNVLLGEYEAIYGHSPEDTTIGLRLRRLIQNAHKATGKKAVVLIDEYDKPLFDSVHDDGLSESFRTDLQGFYSVIKESDEHIRFAMLTGVGKFGHVSIFSGLNNLNDISLDDDYNTVCGISETEFRRDFPTSVRDFAQTRGLTEEEVWQRFRANYDGYHFSKSGEGLYNPFSVLLAFQKNEIDDYWFQSGTPTFLVKTIQKYNYPLDALEGAVVSRDDLSDITDPGNNFYALFYQTGYLTIKGFEPQTREYVLGFPNDEVRTGFWNVLFRQYVLMRQPRSVFGISAFVSDVNSGNPDAFMERLQALVATISPGTEKGKEIHFQNIVQVIFHMLGFQVHTEIRSAYGRCDMIVETATHVYILEFKIDSTPQCALRQIRDKGYAAPFAADPRRVFLIGANFSTATDTLDGYLVEEA